jgi:hypothetical protein
VELLPQRAARLSALAAAIVAAALLALPATAGARPPLEIPESQTEPPRFFELSAKEAEAIAGRASKVRAERRRHPDLDATAYTRGEGRWQVSYFAGGQERAQVRSTTAAARSWSSGAATRWPGRWRAATRARSAAS